MEFPDKSKPPTQKRVVKPVITGTTRSDKTTSHRFFKYLFAESPKELSFRVARDVIGPRIKLGVEEALNTFISGMFWGNGGRPMGGIVAGTVLRSGPGVNYNGVSTGPQSQLALAQVQTTTNRSPGSYSPVVADTMQQAELVIANVLDLFNEYRVVAVGDLYEMANIKPSTADNAYGWYSLDGIRIEKSRDGFEIVMPRPVRIS